MRVRELFSSIRNTLQDHDANYWDDSEILGYYNECVRAMAAERLEDRTTATLTLDPVKNTYDTTGILRYIRCIDDEGTTRKLYPDDLSGKDDTTGVIVQNYNKVYVNDPTIGTVLTFNVVAFPQDSNTGSDVRVGDENALKYYILSKAYEKDTDMANFQKADYFFNKYTIEMARLVSAASVNYGTEDINKTTSYFY